MSIDPDLKAADVQAMTAPGYLYLIVIVSYFKRALLTVEMPIAERLRMLEGINDCVDNTFTEAALAAIEPACNTAVEMIHECFKVDEGNRRSGKSLDLLASREVFGHLAALNPSLLTAIKLFRGNMP